MIFICMNIKRFQFKDSMVFLPSALERLVLLTKYKTADGLIDGSIPWTKRDYYEDWQNKFRYEST